MSDSAHSSNRISKLSTKANAFSIESLISCNEKIETDRPLSTESISLENNEDLKGIFMFCNFCAQNQKTNDF